MDYADNRTTDWTMWVHHEPACKDRQQVFPASAGSRLEMAILPAIYLWQLGAMNTNPYLRRWARLCQTSRQIGSIRGGSHSGDFAEIIVVR
ncbi:MAG TPA: hypothetical protein VH301_13565, partial [Usitatibacter sp.]|nr:hypothetical protein [Usitatibacter sp.]